jgi:hypothetical protein
MAEILIEYKSEPCDTYFNNKVIRFYKDYSNSGEEYFFKFKRKKYIISESEFLKLNDITMKLSFKNILPEHIAGCDGEWESIKIERGFNSIEFKWWCDSAGQQWNDLYKLRDYIMELKDKYIDE